MREFYAALIQLNWHEILRLNDLCPRAERSLVMLSWLKNDLIVDGAFGLVKVKWKRIIEVDKSKHRKNLIHITLYVSPLNSFWFPVKYLERAVF